MTRLIKVFDSAVNIAVLVIFLLLFAYGCYAMWDSDQVYRTAGFMQYESYKPSEENSLSFEELKTVNEDVFGWLTIYGTNIDYPLVQAGNNRTYVNTNVMGEYQLSGSIFLDYRNSKDFTDFNSIIYGHHMEKETMFGEIGNFVDKAYFEERRFGNLYYGGKDHGIEFFAFIEADAYDNQIYKPAVYGVPNQQEYINNLLENALYTRDIEISPADHIVLLSTCTSDATNGRHILAGRITDEVYVNTFETDGETLQTRVDLDGFLQKLSGISSWIWLITIILLIAIVTVITDVLPRLLRKKERRKKSDDQKESS